MQWLEQIPELFSRAIYLLALSTTPSLLSPEPGPLGWPARALLALSFALIVYLAIRLREKIPGRLTTAGLLLLGAAALSALCVGIAQHGKSLPLGPNVLYVAPLLWMGLASLAAGAARRHLVALHRSSGRIAPLLLLGLGGILFLRAPWLHSSQASWLEVLRREPGATFAMKALLDEPLRARSHDLALELAERCFDMAPDGCACHAGRAEVAMRKGAGGAFAHARSAASLCPDDLEIRAILVEALVLEGEADWAEQEARAALAKGNGARLRHALAMALARKGRAEEAAEEAKRAMKLGAGRDSALLLGAILVATGDFEEAKAALSLLLSANPADAAALYNLALIADKEGDYNGARQGYLGALRADPGLASARYNLAVLAYRHGVLEEARHHARSFAEAFPDDSRGASLLRIVATGQGGGRSD